MGCFSPETEDASHGKDDDAHGNGDVAKKRGPVNHKKNQGIKRLPTIFVRNKRPRENIFENVIGVSMLGVPRHDSAETLYLSKLRSHLERAYSDACGRREKLTRAAFLEFLKRVQGDEVENQPPSKEHYTYEEFLEEWSVKYGLGALRPLTPDQKDLSKPISNYFISSSHNTYLEGHQIYSQSSSQIYQKVLDRHCRCIEIDVWDGGTSVYTLRSKSPDPTHKRHHSSSSLPTYEGMNQRIIVPRPPRLHRRQVSAREPMEGPSTSAEDSSSSDSMDTETLGDRLVVPQARLKSSVNDSEPVVMHAHKEAKSKRVFTLTTPVGFREVCKAEIMVKIMKEEWAGYLLDKPFDDCNPLERQPRLEELLDKILVKVKRSQSKATVSTPKIPTLAVPTLYDDDLSPSDEERCERTGERKTPICEALAALAVYTHSEHFKAFGTPSARTNGHIFSIVEGEILRLFEKNPADLLQHNRHYMMRAYPHPFWRIGSHNPDPSLFWRKGVQMVALNWQDDKYDKMALHDAMFTEDTQGWVLKPRGYRSTDDEGDKPDCRTLTLRITIYAGLYIPLPEAKSDRSDASGEAIIGDGDSYKHFKPSVQVDLIVSHEKPSGKLVQKTTAKETTHPNWGAGGCSLEFVGVPNVVDELSFVRFKIRDESRYRQQSAVAAWACIRLDRLRQGYRLIDLTDCKGNPSEGKLFVKIDKVLREPMGLVRSKTMKWWDQMRFSR